MSTTIYRLARVAAPVLSLFLGQIFGSIDGRAQNAASAVTPGDPVIGATIFVRQCALCHTIDRGRANGFGPNLFGIADRKAASFPGYNYSPEFIKMATWTWSPDGIRSFIAAPGTTIPGNKMGVFQGVADKDLDDIIAYLARQE